MTHSANGVVLVLCNCLFLEKLESKKKALAFQTEK